MLHDLAATVFKCFDILFLSALLTEVNYLSDSGAVFIGIKAMKAFLTRRIQESKTHQGEKNLFHEGSTISFERKIINAAC